MNSKNIIFASNLQRIAACPASFEFVKRFSSASTIHSERGSYLHTLVESLLLIDNPNEVAERLSVYDFEERKSVEYCLNKRKFILQGKRIIENLSELELQYKNLIIGKFDNLVICEGAEAYLFDWKFGYTTVAAASENLQLKAYALLIFTKYKGLNKLSVYVISANSKNKSSSCKVYYRRDISALAKNLEKLCYLALSKTAPFAESRGKYCNFCPAKVSCEVGNTKKMLVLRGFHGSGKTAKAGDKIREYESQNKTVKVASSLDYFIDVRHYSFNQIELFKAYKQCERNVLMYAEMNTDVIIIDDTNISKSFIETYAKIAKRFFYSFELIEPADMEKYKLLRAAKESAKIKNLLKRFAKRTSHIVNLEYIEAQAKKYDKMEIKI